MYHEQSRKGEYLATSLSRTFYRNLKGRVHAPDLGHVEGKGLKGGREALVDHLRPVDRHRRPASLKAIWVVGKEGEGGWGIEKMKESTTWRHKLISSYLGERLDQKKGI